MLAHDKLVRSALFVDFDNIYSGLREIDARAAERFATNPHAWVEWMIAGMPTPETRTEARPERTILIRRCYLNPERFQRHRSDFTRAGFEVVDCPPLTRQGKTSTDIRMVMDILDTLKHETYFGEFILLSSDADFTPVLLRLRSMDRRTLVLTVGPAARAYRSACEQVVDEVYFIEAGLGVNAPETARAAAYAGLTEHIKSLGTAQASLERETVKLVGALRASGSRGRWGEIQLQRVVEMAGMLAHCDFTVQASVGTEDGRQRPDLVVRLPGGKSIDVAECGAVGVKGAIIVASGFRSAGASGLILEQETRQAARAGA